MRLTTAGGGALARASSTPQRGAGSLTEGERGATQWLQRRAWGTRREGEERRARAHPIDRPPHGVRARAAGARRSSLNSACLRQLSGDPLAMPRQHAPRRGVRHRAQPQRLPREAYRRASASASAPRPRPRRRARDHSEDPAPGGGERGRGVGQQMRVIVRKKREEIDPAVAQPVRLVRGEGRGVSD